MNEAIKLAIEKGGYQPRVTIKHEWHDQITISDPLFWQALGKALGGKWKAYIQGRWNTEEKDGGDEEKFWKELL